MTDCTPHVHTASTLRRWAIWNRIHGAPKAAIDCVATPGPLPAAPFAWAKPLAAVVAVPLIAGGVVAGYGLAAGGGGGGLRGAADRGAVPMVTGDAVGLPLVGPGAGGAEAPFRVAGGLADLGERGALGAGLFGLGAPALTEAAAPFVVSKPPQNVVEPSSLAVLAVGVVLVACGRRRR